MKSILKFLAVIFLAIGVFVFILGVFMANQPDNSSHAMSPSQASIPFIVLGIISTTFGFVFNKFSN